MEGKQQDEVRGLTKVVCIQPTRAADEPYRVRSVDAYFGRGVPSRLTGVSVRSEANFLSLLQARYAREGMRFYNVYVDGGDMQPLAKDAAGLRTKKIVPLDTSLNSVIRSLAADILHLPDEREAFMKGLARDPGLLNRLWEHELFAHVRAFFWRAEIPFAGKSTSIRFVSVRDVSCVHHVHCITRPDLGSGGMSIEFA
ncbi:MAG: hypothetical protein K5657_04405 [Desulfovibrio sp.]|nr:hypothetical protein [Desulfovibrio sp.]